MSTDHTAIIARYKKDLLRLAQESCTKVASLTVEGTPVLSGSLRASWTGSLNSPRTNNVDIGGGARAGRNDITGVLNGMRLGDRFYLSNGQPYARRIEYEGWSAKAKGGMMRVAIAQWQRVVSAQARAQAR